MTTPKKKYYKGGYLVKNMESGKIVSVSTVAAISDMIPEVSQETILRYIRLGNVQRLSTTPFLLKRATCATAWEEYSSARSHRARGPQRSLSDRPVKCLDIDTQEVSHYANPSMVVEAFGFARGPIYQSLASGEDNLSTGVVDSRWVFRFAEHPFPVIDYDDPRLKCRRTVPDQVLVKFLHSGEVVRYRKRDQCLQDLGLTLAEFKNVLLWRTQKVSKPGVLLKPVFDTTPWLS